MSYPIIFADLPATFPEKDRFRKPSLIGSVVFHVVLITTLVLVPLLFPKNIEEWRLMTMLVLPLPPPPAAAPPAPAAQALPRPQAPKVQMKINANPDALIAPIVVPKDIATIVDLPLEPNMGVIGGVPGGIPGGTVGGVMGGFLAANARAELATPPPPPPPPPVVQAMRPKAPVRVGGDVQEPKIIKLVPPVYPLLASKARVSGTVVLEATLTAEGTVEEIHVISGHPLLVAAAIDCVRQWLYEPTFLNGEPVSVILTARVSFSQRTAQ